MVSLGAKHTKHVSQVSLHVTTVYRLNTNISCVCAYTYTQTY